MASSLRQQLSELASSFANDVLQAIRSASIQDLLAESGGGGGGGGVRRAGRRPASRSAAAPAASAPAAPARPARASGRGGRLARRNAGDIAQVIDRIVGLVKATPRGLRAEEIRKRLGMQSKELPRPLREAVAAGRLGKSGQKRATTYFAKSGGGGGGAAPKRAASKKARKK